MEVKNKDFILIQSEDMKKPMIARVDRVGGNSGKIIAYLAGDEALYRDRDELELHLDPEYVVANLGDNPKAGSVYGLKIEPFFSKFKIECSDHPVGVMLRMRKSEVAEYKEAFEKFSAWAKKYRFEKYIRDIRYFIRPGTGRHQGYWKYKDGIEEITLFHLLNPNAVPHPVEYVLAHEIGHHFFERYLTEDEKAEWIALHRQIIALSQLDPNKMNAMRGELEKAGSIKAYRSEIDDDEKEIFKEVMKVVCKTYRVKAADLDNLMASGHSLKDYWVKTPIIQTKDRTILVTEYARKNPQELFAESVAVWMTGGEISTKIKKKVVKSVKAAVTRGTREDVKNASVSG